MDDSRDVKTFVGSLSEAIEFLKEENIRYQNLKSRSFIGDWFPK